MSATGMMIKVCGMRDTANIRAVAELQPSLMGFIFHDPSPRCALGIGREAVIGLDRNIRPVGVFVNKPAGYIDEICRSYGIGIVQLHGDESPEECHVLMQMGYEVFRAIAVTNDMDWEPWRAYEDVVNMFVLDSKSASRGGSGQKFDWSVLDHYPLATPYLLGGGLSPDDATSIAGKMYPGMAGVDLNSRFEDAPGIKNPGMLKQFITSFRKSIEHE